ncbi:hypothetical protein QQG55_48525 [Brugia pahangi]
MHNTQERLPFSTVEAILLSFLRHPPITAHPLSFKFSICAKMTRTLLSLLKFNRLRAITTSRHPTDQDDSPSTKRIWYKSHLSLYLSQFTVLQY